MKHKKTALIASGALVVIVGGCSAAVIAGSSGQGIKTSPPAATHSTSAAPAATHAAQPSPSAVPTTPAAPAMTVSQQQAVDSAQNYLNDGQGFSEAGLLKQLTSSYGEGDTAADAQFAISHLHPDWYQQAVKSAKNYIADGQGFSKASLYEQLTSSYGESFTAGQANYALSKVGL